MELKDKLRELRVKGGYTQQKIAEHLGIDRSTYAYYEIGTTNPSVYNLKRLAQLYKISVDVLLETDGGAALRVATDSACDDLSVHLTKEEAEIISIYRELSNDKKESLLNLLKTFRA